MPIIFVHGVNNRDGAAYRENVKSRNSFLREIIGPALGLNPDKLHLESPYWGGQGAQFAWGMAVLPNSGEEFETFGGSDEAEAFGRVVSIVANSALDGKLTIIDNAKKDLSGVIDALYASAMAGASTEEEARDLARSYLLAAEYAEKYPEPEWVASAKESNFIDQLNYKAQVSAIEQFGAGGILDSLKEGLSRLASALPDANSSLLVHLSRKQLNSEVTRFTGDVFTYLKRRGTKDNPGEIVKVVRDSLRHAAANITTEDNKLIVIAHSFGGEIVYDILTHFDTNLKVDCLVTVGSQVGLFEEMKLYIESKDTIPPDPPNGKVQKPSNLKQWLNVFDLNDVFSYRVEPVFANTSDYFYDTGYHSLSAHGGYFMRPSFYKRLASRLQEM